MRLGMLGVVPAMAAAAVALASSAHADVDTDFADEVHGYDRGPASLPLASSAS
jgi:hypothetical protein